MSACESATAPESVTAPKASEPGAAGVIATAQPDPVAALQPPDGTWLRDAEGQEYYAQRLEMPPQSYVWIDPEKTRARIRHGLEVEVLAHDDDSITIKVYRADEEMPAPPGRSAPSEQDLARVAASYEPDAEEGEGRRLVAIGQGLPQRGQWRNGFDVADVDGDGHADIAFGPPRKSRRPPTIFRGDGAGHWTAWQEARFPALPFDYGDAAVADLNGDGHADIVLASHLRGIVATVGDGRGGFSAWSKGMEFVLPGGEDQATAFSSRAIAVADWNRDGRPDVIALGEGPQLTIAAARGAVQSGSRGLAVYLNGGDGTWTKRADPGSGSFGSSLVVADVNGDGLLDAVTGSERRGFRGLLNLGQPDGSWCEVEITGVRAGAIARAIAVADFDRDGKQDLAIGHLSTEFDVDRRGIDVLLARGDGWQRKTLLADNSREMIAALATGDVDGDGAADLAAVDERGQLLLFRGDGRGGFVHEPLATPPVETCAGYGLLLRNVDGAPGDEIVVSHADEDDANAISGRPACPSQGALRVWRIGG